MTSELVGQPIPVILPGLLSDLGGAGITLRGVPAKSGELSTDLSDPQSRRAVEEAMRLRSAYGVPYWDGVLSALERGVLPSQLLDAALRHNARADHEPEIGVVGLDAKQIRDKADELPDGMVLALSSRVKCVGSLTHRHLPMLDFRWKPSPEARRGILVMMRAMAVQGLLLESGNSFHFIGTRLVTETEFVRFFGRSLLCGSMIDRRWVAHQLIEGDAALRITTPRVNGPRREPIVVDVLA
jgi:hypothetical protein